MPQSNHYIADEWVSVYLQPLFSFKIKIIAPETLAVFTQPVSDFLLSLFFLTLCLSVLFFLRFRKNKNQQSLEINRKKEITTLKNELAYTLHDELSGHIANLTILPVIINDKTRKKESIDLEIQALQKTTEGISNGLQQVYLTLENRANNIAGIISQVDTHAKTLFYGHTINYRLENRIDHLQHKTLPADHATILTSSLKEGLNNVLKHARCKDVILSFSQKNNEELLFHIKDNGIGIPDQKTVNDSGLKKSGERLAKINANASVFSKKGVGTSLRILYKMK